MEKSAEKMTLQEVQELREKERLEQEIYDELEAAIARRCIPFGNHHG
jgi:hypothetical protein